MARTPSALRTLLGTFLLAAMLAGFGSATDPGAAGRTDAPVVRKPAPLSPAATYSVEAGIDGEIFPMFANFASLRSAEKREWGVITVSIHNPTGTSLRQRVAVTIAGWSDQEIQIVEVAPGESRSLYFAPTFYPALFQNREIRPATAQVEVTSLAGQVIFSTTSAVRLRSAEDMYWGKRFKYAPFIASWVTPHDERVEHLLTAAKEHMPGRRLPGYEPWKNAAEQERSTELQARALYLAVQEHGVSYVKSSLTFGANAQVSQRVRKPRESLDRASANCIDSAVMFASLFENLALDPIVVLVPGHAYVGVRVARNSPRYLFLDVALVGRASFDTAQKAAERGLAKFGATQITRIPIEEARTAGIYPMP